MVNANASTYSSANFMKFLDSSQYTTSGVQKYEIIFGKGFISTGGLDTTISLCEQFLDGKIPQGAKILDVGCGIGGGTALLADRYNASVIGIDLSSNVLAVAQGRYKENTQLQFVLQDALTAEYADEQFDVIYSRDTILHVEDKLKLYSLFYKWLKPGGILLVTDYACGPEELQTQEFKAYVAQRGYHLLTCREYQAVVEAAGFKDAKCDDQTQVFRECLEKEKGRLVTEGEAQKEFLAAYSEQELKSLLEGWDSKLNRTAHGAQVWARIYATKA